MKIEKPKMTREEYDKILAELPGGENADQPVYLSIKTDLGNISGEGSGWRNLLDAIAAAGKYVDLDLSVCTMHGADFNPAVGIKTGKEKIVSIILPNETKSIGLNPADGEKAAFRHFANLKSVSGKGVESIGGYAFYDCKKLVGVDFPAASCICEYAFSQCGSLASVEFPVAVTIGEGVFNKCTGLARVNFPAAVNLSNDVFRDCHSLAEFVLTGDGSLSLIEDRKALVRDNTELVAYPAASGSITLDNITSIAEGAFHGCKNLVNVGFPLVTNIGDDAFNCCKNLLGADFPSAHSIGRAAFFVCVKLAKLNLPSAAAIGKAAFSACSSLVNIDLPSASSIDENAFSNCTSLSKVSFPTAVNLLDAAFAACQSLSKFVLKGDGSLSAIEDGKALVRNNTELVAYPSASGSITLDNITKIARSAFFGCIVH